MAIDASTIAKINEAEGVFMAVLTDIEAVEPAGTPIGNGLIITSSLLPVIVQSLLAAVKLVQAKQPTA